MMEGGVGAGAQPAAGVLSFRKVSDEIGDTPWYLRLRRDEAQAAERIAFVLASSKYATGLLLRAPETVQLLAADAELAPGPRDALTAEALAAVGRHASAEDGVTAVRSLRRRELLRTAVASLLGRGGGEGTGGALTTVTAGTISASLQAATQQ